MKEEFKPSIAIKGAMKDLDYVYDFIKNMQKTKDLGKELEKELGRKPDKIDIELARELIVEMNDYLQAANVAKGKVKDVLSVLANTINYLESKGESVTESYEEQIKEDKQIRELINKIKEYNPKVKIIKEVDNDDEIVLFLEGEKKGMLTIDVVRYRAILEYEDGDRTRKIFYDLTDEKDYEGLLHDISFYLVPPKLDEVEEKQEEVDNKENSDLDRKLDEIIQYYKQKGIELDKERLKHLIKKYRNLNKEEFKEDSELIDSKINDDGIRIDLVKVGNKYYIFSGDKRLGPYEDELEARQDFNDF